MNVEIRRKRGTEHTEWNIPYNNANTVLERLCVLMREHFQCQLDNPWPQYLPFYVNRVKKGCCIRFASINKIANYYYKVWYKGDKVVIVPEH